MTDNLYFPDAIQLRDAGIRNGTRVFTLEHYFRYVSSHGIITVPTGFITDGASVPRIFWPIFDPFGGYFHAAIIHDYLYSRWSTAHFNCDRATADLIFKEAMWNRGIGCMTRETIYRAVRLCGWRSYKKK